MAGEKGMLYTLNSFTLPSAPSGVSDIKWDYSTMTRAEFIEKYGEDKYKETGCATDKH
jgi:hypothetical protein